MTEETFFLPTGPRRMILKCSVRCDNFQIAIFVDGLEFYSKPDVVSSPAGTDQAAADKLPEQSSAV